MTAPVEARPEALVAGEPAELRLVVPAASAWLVAALAVSVPPVAGLVGAFVLAGLGCAAVTWSWQRTAPRRPRTTAVRVTAVALLCAAGAAAAGALRVAAVARGPLPSLARNRAAVTLELVVTADPRESESSESAASSAAGATRRPVVIVLAKATRFTAAGRTTAISSPVVVLASSPGWLTLQPSQHVTAAGRLEAPEPGELESAVFDARGSPTRVGPASLVERIAGRIRSGLQAAARPLPSASRGLLPGLVDGDTSQLRPDVAAWFKTTGLTHVVAVSGANVAIMLGAALVLARYLGAGLRAQALIGALTIIGFVVVARPQASVLRAAAMGLVAVLALATGRRRRALPALCAAVLCLVYIDPTLSLSIGFALSVLATAALLVLAPVLRRSMTRRLPAALAEALAVPTAATIVCAPLIASISGRVSLSSIPANLLAEPAVAPATILGVVTACVAPFWLTGAQMLARLAGLPCEWLVLVARTFAQLPGSALPWPSGAFGAFALVVVFGAGGVVFVLRHGIRRRLGARRRPVSSRPRAMRRMVAIGAVCAVAMTAVAGAGFVVVHMWAGPSWPGRGWALAVCDVGQGDAVVARTGPAAATLFDAGPTPSAVDRCLTALGVRALSIVVTSSGTSDIDGLPGAMHGRVVDAIDVGGGFDPPALARVRAWAAAARASVTDVGVGGRGAMRWRVVADLGSSLVVDVASAAVSAVVVGDLKQADAVRLGELTAVPRADVLLIPNHGADDDDAALLTGVRPLLAVISVGGGNPQRDPAAATLTSLATTATRTIRTDQDGPVAISGESDRLHVVTRAGVDAVRPRSSPPSTAAAATSDWLMTCCGACLSTAPTTHRVAVSLARRSLRQRLSPSSSVTKSFSSNARSPPLSRAAERSTPTLTCGTLSAQSSRRGNSPN